MFLVVNLGESLSDGFTLHLSVVGNVYSLFILYFLETFMELQKRIVWKFDEVRLLNFDLNVVYSRLE